MMDSASMPRFEAMTTGVLLDRAFRLYTGNFSLMLGITAAAYVPFYLIMVLIEGQNATPSLRRSRDLVKGHRGKVFCVMFIINLLQGILALGVSMVSGMIFNSDSAGGAVLNSAMNNLLSIFLTPLGIVATI